MYTKITAVLAAVILAAFAIKAYWPATLDWPSLLHTTARLFLFGKFVIWIAGAALAFISFMAARRAKRNAAQASVRSST